MPIDTAINYLQNKLETIFHPQEDAQAIRRKYKDRIQVEKILNKYGSQLLNNHALDSVCHLDDMIRMENAQAIEKAISALINVRHI